MIYCIILTNNSRSYTYIDYLVKKKLNPKQVILIDDNKNLRIKKLILQRIDKKINVKIFKSKTINDKNILKYIKSLNQKIFVYSGYPGQLVKDDKLLKKLKLQIRKNASPRHVPTKIIVVKDIPRTKSGKIVELAVKSRIEGSEIKNMEALANPEALENYSNLKELSF